MGFLKFALSVVFIAVAAYVGMGVYDRHNLPSAGDKAVPVTNKEASTPGAVPAGKEAGDEKGLYNGESGLYTNQRYGFKIMIPNGWKTYTVKEAISCPTINKEYADCYYLIASPNGSTDTTITIDKATCPEDYVNSFTEEKWKSYASNDHPQLLYEVKDIGGIKVHRAGYNIAGCYRENNYFMANHQLMEIYIIGKSSDDPAISNMRSVIDGSLSTI